MECGDVLHVGVDAGGGDPQVRPPVGLRDVDLALAAGGEHVAGAPQVGPDAELAREVVAPPAREDAEHAVRPRGARPATAPSRPSPPMAAAISPRSSVARASSRAWSSDAVRSTRKATPRARRALLHSWQEPRRAAASGARVDDEAEGAGHAGAN